MKIILAKLLIPFIALSLFLASFAGHAQEGEYTLDQGDRISILVFDEPDLTLEAQVGATGVISYSYLGDLQIAGKTTREIEQFITEKLKDGYLVNPSVNVSIVEYRPFYINGEVRSPGSYPYEQGLTIEKAIALAGGMTDRASRRKMYVLREIEEEDGKPNKQARVGMSGRVFPGDIVTIREGFF